MRDYPRLSASRIKSTKATDHDIWLSDSGGWRGFGQLLLRITPRGTRRFYFRYTHRGQRKTITLGRYARNQAPGFLTLSQARALAGTYATSIANSALASAPTSPVSIEQRSREPIDNAPSRHEEANHPGSIQDELRGTASVAASAAPRLTLMELCDHYVRWLEKQKKSSWKETRSLLRLHVGNSELASRLAGNVEAPQIATLLRKMVQDGKGRTAAKIRGMLRAAYARAIGAELSPTDSGESIDSSIRINPVVAIPAMPEFRRARRRALSKAELKEFWRRLSTGRESKDEPLAVRALRLGILLGGQRFEQLRNVDIGNVDVDGGFILLFDPKGRREHPRPHLLPLTATARAEVEWLVAHSRVCDATCLLVGRTKGTVLSLSTVSTFVKAICADMLAKGQATSQFQFSDLRRTIETTLASLGVHRDIRAQVQSHGISGVQSTHYDMYDYMAEKRAALELWENYLKSLVPD